MMSHRVAGYVQTARRACRFAVIPTLLSLFAAPAIAAPPPASWTQAAALTPAGSHVLGNPAAKLKLVEYISYTCSHCAAFQTASEATLRAKYVAGGNVSVEVRHLLRDPIDLAAALLTNCGAPAKFFGNHNALLSTQASWLKVADNATDAQHQRWSSGPVPARARAIAADLGFYAIMAKRGYARAQADKCLADQAMVKRLTAQRAEGVRLGVQGTPSFFLNGAMLAGTYDWPSLETQLEARL